MNMRDKGIYEKFRIVERLVGKWFVPFCYSAFKYAILICISYLALYPMLRCLSIALTPASDYMAGVVNWIPENPTLQNFWNSSNIFDYVDYASITILIVVVCTCIQLIVSSLVGYGLARYRFKGNMIVFFCVIVTIILPMQTIQIPLYTNYKYFDFFGIGDIIGLFTGKPITVNVLNTIWTYIVPALFGLGLNSGLFIFLFRQFFKGMPKDLEDAGRVDGCNPLMIFTRIMMPNVTPVITTVALLSAVYYWNDSMLAGMFMHSKSAQPIMYAVTLLDTLVLESTNDELSGMADVTVQKNAIMFVTVIPLVIIFLIGQKFFVECMDRSGIKG